MTAGRWILLAFHWQIAALSWLLGGLLLLCRVVHTPRWEGAVLMTTRRAGATSSLTFGRFVGFTEAGRASLRVKRHELTHVAQSEDLAFAGFVVGSLLGGALALAGAPWWAAFAAWRALWLGLPFILALEYVTAPLRYGVAGGPGSWLARWYRTGARMSQHERSAYAQSDDPAAWERAERQHRGDAR